MLKFKPREGTWYLADRDTTGMLVPNGNPKIGIGAVECIGIKAVSENKRLSNIGVYLRRGSSLALYDRPEEIDRKFNRTRLDLEDALVPVPAPTIKNGAFVNPNLFGKEKYAILRLTNLGSWQEASWLSTIHRYADQYFAWFVVHAYVLGEWNVKPLSISEPTPRPPFEMKRSGLLDFLLPDIGPGILGKLLSGGGCFLIGAMLLILFFPPAGILLNKLMGWLVAMAPGVENLKNPYLPKGKQGLLNRN